MLVDSLESRGKFKGHEIRKTSNRLSEKFIRRVVDRFQNENRASGIHKKEATEEFQFQLSFRLGGVRIGFFEHMIILDNLAKCSEL